MTPTDRAIEVAVSAQRRRMNRILADPNRMREHGILFDPSDPDTEQAAYERQQHQHRRRIDWWHVGGIVVCLAAAAITVTAIVGAVGVVEGWWT